MVELLPPVTDTPLAAGLNPSFARMPPEKLVEAFLTGLRRGHAPWTDQPKAYSDAVRAWVLGGHLRL